MMFVIPSEEFFMPRRSFSPRTTHDHPCCRFRSRTGGINTTKLFSEMPYVFLDRPESFRDCRRRSRSLQSIPTEVLIDRFGQLIREQNLTQKMPEERQKGEVLKDTEKGLKDTAEANEQQQQTGPEQKFITLPELIQKIRESVNPGYHSSRPCCRATNNNDKCKAVDSNCSDPTKETQDQFATKDLMTQDDQSGNFRVDIKTGNFEPEEIQVKIKDGFLSVRAQREEKDEKEGIFRYQKLEKVVKLPDGVEPDDVSAEMKDGLLTLLAPKVSQQEQKLEKIVDIKSHSIGEPKKDDDVQEQGDAPENSNPL